jgi:hypothetical protein
VGGRDATFTKEIWGKNPLTLPHFEGKKRLKSPYLSYEFFPNFLLLVLT